MDRQMVRQSVRHRDSRQTDYAICAGQQGACLSFSSVSSGRDIIKEHRHKQRCCTCTAATFTIMDTD